MRVVCTGGRARREIFADAVVGQSARKGSDVEKLVHELAMRIADEILEGIHYDGVDVDEQVFTVTYDRHALPDPESAYDDEGYYT